MPAINYDSSRAAPATMGVNDVAAYLGLCRGTVLRLMRVGELPAPIRLGKQYFWPRAQIEQLLVTAESSQGPDGNAQKGVNDAE
jgi:excisionase family DNA binding protein